jgi:hypothetical protein
MTDENKLRIKKLEEEGWIKQFIANEPRLSEAVELYKGAGFEVHLEPLPKGEVCETCAGPEEPKECRVCFDGFEDLYKIIFTRAKKEKRSGQAVDLGRAGRLTRKEE